MLAKVADYSWAAGFFDGEGHIRVDPQTRAKTHGYNSIATQITLTQKGTETDPPDVLVRFAELLPGGRFTERRVEQCGDIPSQRSGMSKQHSSQCSPGSVNVVQQKPMNAFRQ